MLGLEQDAGRVATANQRSTQSQGRCVFRELTLRSSDDLAARMDSLVDAWLVDDVVDDVALCLVGLHSCGDLSPAMLRLFLSTGRRSFQTLLLVSCCYHRISEADHFPMSRRLTDALDACALGGHLRGDQLTYFFRLAAQETTNRWLITPLRRTNQLYHTFHRALLQLYAVQSEPRSIHYRTTRKKNKYANKSDAIECNVSN